MSGNAKLSHYLLAVLLIFLFATLSAPSARAQTTNYNRPVSDTNPLDSARFWRAGSLAAPQDPLDLSCNSSLSCFSGSTGNILVASGLPTFTLSEVGNVTSGTLNAYFTVVVPDSPSVSFSVNGVSDTSAMVVTINSSSPNLFTNLGLSYPSGFTSSSVPSFSNFNTAAGQVIGTQTQFTAYVFPVGSCTGCTTIPNITVSVTGTSLPLGTTFFAYLTDSNGSTNVVADTDYSETVTVTPEPATLGLLGTGMLLIGMLIRKRLTPETDQSASPATHDG